MKTMNKLGIRLLKSDYSLRINFWEEAIKLGHKEGSNLNEFGYIVASCSNMKKPKAYAFHVCYEASSDNENPCKIETDERGYVSLARFSYPEEVPHIGQAVNFPVEYDKYGWYPSENK